MQEEIPFGVWLRKQRRALDLSRQAFANQAGCAEVTLRRIEAGTLKPSQALASILLEKLGIPETERPGWISFARGVSGFPPSVSSSTNKPHTNLPAQITSFIGREKEQADVVSLISKHRLVTLTGSGGIGKTRLSIKVGEQIIDNYTSGIWLVELAPILDPVLVPRTTAIAIGLRDEPKRPIIDMLSDFLREKNILIILDNCEQLLDSCVQLADTLLKRCPDLKILATSREVLGILGEATYRVPSLELPDLQLSLKDIRRYESARLFEERAQLARIDFSMTLENASSVAEICSRLDGVPLAIELAAARMGTFSTVQIEERLQKSLSLLTMGNRTALPRHQTLQATIDWSYELLSSAEQTLFRRLSVFARGWTLEAAEAICSDVSVKSEAIPDLLAQLINKSLVVSQDDHGRTRYRMLGIIQQYANEKLVEADEDSTLRDRHLEYYSYLAETVAPHLCRSEQLEWLPLLDADYENLRFALEWALSRESPEPSQKLCSSLVDFWSIRWYCLEGLNWVKRALAKPYHNESTDEKVARARALYTCAGLEWELSNFEQILSPAKESLALALEVSERRDIAIARFYVGSALGVTLREDINRARCLLELSLAEFEALDEPLWHALAFYSLGSLLVREGKLKYQDMILKRLALARQAGERQFLAGILSDYADFLLCHNQVDKAREQIEESERLYKQVGLEHNAANSLSLVEIAWIEGNYEKARLFCSEIREYFSMLGHKFWPAAITSRQAILAMEEGDLEQAKVYLEQSLTLTIEIGYKPHISLRLAELGNLSYLKGNLEEFKQRFRESLSFKSYLAEIHLFRLLLTILGSLYSQKPEVSARLLGVLSSYEKEDYFPFTPLEKRYCRRAEAHACKVLSNTDFEAAFADGQRMSIDEALDLALKTVEEIE
jgi:predicted ATPase/DNA-binding XRE family transcriptional regulator